MNKKRLFINFISNIVVFLVSIGINFLTTPYLVKELGNEAYGFIGLSNNFSGYLQIMTIALNSMVARYIAISVHNNLIDEGNYYFSSTFYANLILGLIIGLSAAVFIPNIESFIYIPKHLVLDVKTTFLIVCLSLITSLLGSVFNVGVFLKNRLDIGSLVGISGNFMRIVALFLLFYLFSPKIYFIAISFLIFNVYVWLVSILVTKKIAPELALSMSNIRLTHIKTLITSGMWRSIESLSFSLFSGLDLYFANQFISANAMGMLSITKIVPIGIDGLATAMSGSFNPQLTLLYSKNRIDDMVKELNFAIKLISFVMLTPNALILIFCSSFYTLWLKGKTIQEIHQLHLLTALPILAITVYTCIMPVYQLRTITNNVKIPAIIMLINAALSAFTVFIALKVGHLGIYAITGISSIYLAARILFFDMPMAAMYLHLKWTVFFSPLKRSALCLAVLAPIFAMGSYFLNINNWWEFIWKLFLVGMLGYAISLVILFDKIERKSLTNLLRTKFLRKNGAISL